MIVLNVYYQVKEGKKREDFYNAIMEAGVAQKSRAEEGNIKYDYYFAMEDEQQVLLVEYWKDEDAFEFHKQTDHFKNGLTDIKAEYLDSVEIKRYME